MSRSRSAAQCRHHRPADHSRSDGRSAVATLRPTGARARRAEIAGRRSPTPAVPQSPVRSLRSDRRDATARRAPARAPRAADLGRGRPLSLDSPELAFAPSTSSPPSPEPTPEPAAREPRLTKEQILQEIQAEAQQKKAEQANLGREVEASKAREFFETIRKAHDDRGPFHDELRRLLHEAREGRGTRDQEPVRPLRANHAPRYREGRDPFAQPVGRPAQSRRQDQSCCGLQGLPEPVILDDLANELDLQIRGTRGRPARPQRSPRPRRDSSCSSIHRLRVPEASSAAALRHAHVRCGDAPRADSLILFKGFLMRLRVPDSCSGTAPARSRSPRVDRSPTT